ncbi:hypothetical protein niasHT_028429 [Heterodera trifolii]|uniref:Uncharacterized protein n=1 Tax=Heterodera trifolii TaxID=157864 RepID=A0ABD2JKN8_9BILA
MSAHYRSQINRLCAEAADVLGDQKTFEIPARPQGTPDNVFSSNVRTQIKSLNNEMEDVSEVTNELSNATEKWMTLRSSMTGAERTVDNPLYDTFVAQTDYHNVLADLRKYFKSLRNQKRALEAVIPGQVAPVTPIPSSAPLMHLPKTELPTFAGDYAPPPQIVPNVINHTLARFVNFLTKIFPISQNTPIFRNHIHFLKILMCLCIHSPVLQHLYQHSIPRFTIDRTPSQLYHR